MDFYAKLFLEVSKEYKIQLTLDGRISFLHGMHCGENLLKTAQNLTKALTSQLEFTCSKLTLQTLEQGVKYV